MADPPAPQFLFDEAFCAELPSQCNLYLLGKQSSIQSHRRIHHRRRHGGHHRKGGVPAVRFATEQHSLTLLQKNDGGGREYFLSVGRLPSSFSLSSARVSGQQQGKKLERKASSADTSRDICLAHSSVFWEEGDNRLPGSAYRVEFAVEDCGRTIAASKRCVRFKFGFLGDNSYLSEYELIVSWSFSSGKQKISLNGAVIFHKDGDAFSPSRDKLQYSWGDEAGHVMEVNVHAAPLSLEADLDSHWRQHDFQIDGVSFFNMPVFSNLADDKNDIYQTCKFHESSIEVFAMTRTPFVEYYAKEHKSSDDSSFMTYGSHSIADGRKDGSEYNNVNDQKLSVGVSCLTSKNCEAGGNNVENDKNGALQSNYYLMVQSRISSDHTYQTTNGQQRRSRSTDGTEGPRKTAQMSTAMKTIPLDFRPMSVHVTELYVSTDAERNVVMRRPYYLAVGIFVASVDDTKLRLYVATKEALQGIFVEDGIRDKVSCFIPVPLSKGKQSHDVVEDNSLIFSSPIMAIDTSVADEECSVTTLHGNEECSGARLNCLAVACYDGTVRILTFRLQNPAAGNGDDYESAAPRFSLVQCSSFIVDGPVVSLCFGRSGASEILLPRTSSWFLVAGSLCGFACVFYESLLPSSIDGLRSSATLVSDGPLTIVDGLYDAWQEGYEDCVTVVHVCHGTETQPMIAVGAQGGRVLLFQQCQNKIKAHKEDEGWLKTTEMSELVSQIEKKRDEISQLQSEKEDMDIKVRNLNGIISDTQNNIEYLVNKLHASNFENVDPIPSTSVRNHPTEDALDYNCKECLDESTLATAEEEKPESTTIDELPMAMIGKVKTELTSTNGSTMSTAQEEETKPANSNGPPIVILEGQAREKANRNKSTEAMVEGDEKEAKLSNTVANFDSSTDGLSNLKTKLKSAQTQLHGLELKILGHASKIVGLKYAMGNLIKMRNEISAQITITLENGSTNAAIMRKMHRYKFLCEYHLHYPIHGISSSVCWREFNGQELFVLTRRSFHVLHIILVDRRVALLEKKMLKLLTD